MTTNGVYVMIDDLSAFASEQEAVKYIEEVKRLPQTREVLAALASAEQILSALRAGGNSRTIHTTGGTK